jgi:Protein of unknown function (DUF3182)
MTKGTVVVYFGKLGGRLQEHQRTVLFRDAATIATLLSYKFGGEYAANTADRSFFVPDDALLLEEASAIGVRSARDLYGGIVPFPFVKTKAISHSLLNERSAQPAGWSSAFADQVSKVVLRGHTAFTLQDIRRAADRLLACGPIRLKRPLGASGKGQKTIGKLADLDALEEQLSTDELETYGLVLEENLKDVKTISIGLVRLQDMEVAYCGTQRTTKDNEGKAIYGGSSLICVRGGWSTKDSSPPAAITISRKG